MKMTMTQLSDFIESTLKQGCVTLTFLFGVKAVNGRQRYKTFLTGQDSSMQDNNSKTDITDTTDKADKMDNLDNKDNK